MNSRPKNGINCGNCMGRHPTVDEVRACHSTPKIQNLDDVRVLLDEDAPAFSDLLDAMAVCRGAGHEELLDRCIQIALANITGEVPEHRWKPVVREAATRLIRRATRAYLETDVRTAANQLRRVKENKPKNVAEVIEQEAEMLDEVAVLLSDGEPPSLVKTSSRLRKLARPDLAVIVATEAVDGDASSGAARTTRAAAWLDMSKWDDAVEDLGWVEINAPSSYSANAWSRASSMTGDHGEAMSWAETANERDPNGVAGMRSLGKAAAARGDLEKAHWAFEQAGLAEESRSYTLLVSAKELIRAGRTSEGLGIITRLESEGYEPAQRFMLEYRSGRS